MAIYAPLLTVIMIVTDFIRFIIYPILNPLQGITLLNRRYFNSLSGLLGLILALIGAIMHFFIK
jgi:hypothetical protein